MVRVETLGRRGVLPEYAEVDIIVYRVPEPIKFLKKQKNLHRLKISGLYKGEGLPNALSYIWDSWYKKSRLAWQRIFSYTARKKVTKAAPELKQRPAHTYHTEFQRLPQFGRLKGYEFIEQFRYPLWKSKPMAPPDMSRVSDGTNEFIKSKEGCFYISIGKRKPGLYLIEAIIGQHRANTLLFVSDTVAITKISSKQLLIWTVNKHTGATSPNSNILLTDGVGTLKSGTTNEEGILIMQKKNPERSYVIGKDAQGGVFVSENFYYDSEIYATKIYAFTDRPLYRPGDTVHLKLMGRTFKSSNESSPLSPEMVRMVVLDPNGTPLRVNEFEIHDPIAGGDTGFKLPKFAASGGYSIQLTYKGKVYTSAFRVARYTKPHYQIEILLEKENIKTGYPIRGQIKLTYPSGKPVKKAQVNLEVRVQKLSLVEGELRYAGRFPVKLAEKEYGVSKEGTVDFEIPPAKDPSRYILRVRSIDNSNYHVTATKEILIEGELNTFTVMSEKRLSKIGEEALFEWKLQHQTDAYKYKPNFLGSRSFGRSVKILWKN